MLGPSAGGGPWPVAPEAPILRIAQNGGLPDKYGPLAGAREAGTTGPALTRRPRPPTCEKSKYGARAAGSTPTFVPKRAFDPPRRGLP